MIKRVALAGLLALGSLAPVHGSQSLSLSGLMRSLMLVNDRIAEGDSAALPIQGHLMNLIDKRIVEINDPTKVSQPERDLLMIYGIIGVGSDSVSRLIHRLPKTHPPTDAERAVLAYRARRLKQAMSRFAKLDVEGESVNVAPYLAFASGNIYARRRPGKAVTAYNKVRLLAPGTLLEEASLRRLMMLYLKQRNAKQFMRMANQYAHRFVNSPYRKQYLTVLQKGILQLRSTMQNEQISELASLMPDNFAASFYLHTVRKSVLNGYLNLANFGVDELIKLADNSKNVVVNRALLTLLKELSRLTKDEPEMVYQRLIKINKAGLDAKDLELLSGAKTILKSVMAPIDEMVTHSIAKPMEGASRASMSGTESGHEDTQTRKKSSHDGSMNDEHGEKKGMKDDDENGTTSSAQTSSDIIIQQDENDGIAEFITQTRKQLDIVDNMLKD